MEKKQTLEERIIETCGIMAALAAYQAGGDKEAVIRRISRVTGWPLENAECFYNMVERDGVSTWRNTVLGSVEQLTSISNNQ